jgi:hypothetical protein
VSHPWQGRILTIVRIPQNSNIIDKLNKETKSFESCQVLFQHIITLSPFKVYELVKKVEYAIPLLRGGTEGDGVELRWFKFKNSFEYYQNISLTNNKQPTKLNLCLTSES